MPTYSITREEYLYRYAVMLFRMKAERPSRIEAHLREFGRSLIDDTALVDRIIDEAREEF